MEGALRTKRGVRALFEPVVLKLLAYFKAKDMGIVNLPLDPPSSAIDVEDWKEEWRDYARDAGLTDTSDVSLFFRQPAGRGSARSARRAA